MRALTRFRFPLLALGLALSVGCNADSPSSPTAPPANPVPPSVGVNVSISSSTNALEAGGNGFATLIIRATRADNGQPVPNLTSGTVTTTLGNFGSVSGPQTIEIELVNGQATVILFPGGVIGTASMRAAVSTGVAFTSVAITEPGLPATFFISSVSPNTGSPQGGETVTIFGGGFSGPFRVTFGALPAEVQSSTSSQIRVTTPPCSFDGTNACFAPGAATPVAVTVIINLNEEDEATDALGNGFVYQGTGGGNLQPIVFSVTPSSGPNEGGTQVTINGDGFEAPVAVDFGDVGNEVAAQVISVTRTRIVVLSPAATGIGLPNLNELVDIRVTNQNTGRTTRALSAFRYGVSILITSIGPGEGPSTGGTIVTVFGQGFDEPVAVSMGLHAQQVLSVSGTEIVVRTVAIVVTGCADVPGATGVTNIETGDSATGPVFVYRAPRLFLTGVSPSSGPQGGGTTVTIFGDGFTAPLTVTFGATSGSVGAITATTVSTTTPPFPDSIFTSLGDCDDDADLIIGTRIGPQSVDVKLTNPATGCTATLAGAFRVTPSTTCRGD